jgi:hypothetical protein
VDAVVLQAEGAGCLGEDVLCAPVEEGDHAALDVESQGAQLRQRSEGCVVGRLREEFMVCLGFGGDGGSFEEAGPLRELAVPGENRLDDYCCEGVRGGE